MGCPAARPTFRVDLNFGDPITPAPAETAYPQLLGGDGRRVDVSDDDHVMANSMTTITTGTGMTMLLMMV